MAHRKNSGSVMARNIFFKISGSRTCSQRDQRFHAAGCYVLAYSSSCSLCCSEISLSAAVVVASRLVFFLATCCLSLQITFLIKPDIIRLISKGLTLRRENFPPFRLVVLFIPSCQNIPSGGYPSNDIPFSAQDSKWVHRRKR